MGANTTTERIDALRPIFACHGLPEQLVSGNGPQFCAALFQTFMKLNGIKPTLVPTYHPASNGTTDRSVRIVNAALKTQVLEGNSKFSISQGLGSFLLKYHTTPQSTTSQPIPC